MTCKEFRQTTTTIDIATMTRGERAAVVRHANDCRRCRRWMGPPSGRPLDADLKVILAADRRDPEFVEAAGLRR